MDSGGYNVLISACLLSAGMGVTLLTKFNAAPAAIVDGEMESISLRDYRGKYVILFFYPKVTV